MSSSYCFLLWVSLILVPFETASDVVLVSVGPRRHQVWNRHRYGQQPDDDTHDDPATPVVRRGRVQRPGDRPVPVDADGSEEEDGAVGVDEEQRAGQPAHEVCVDPVAMAAIIANPERKGAHEKEISDGQVCHVDADFAHGLGLAEAAQDEQHVEVGEEAQDEDDAIGNAEEDITKL